MTSPLVQQLTGVRDLKKILETTVKELGETFRADICQVMLSNPLDPNVYAICDYKAAAGEEIQADLPSVTVPLSLEGKAVGHVRLARSEAVNSDEVNNIRVILGEMADIIRHAQINDIVQRDTFRNTFLLEIGNVMAYSLGIGDALFMVVNILGKVLHASRCIFICTDDSQAGWKCYEFWQQDKVQSCQSFCWPTTDSPAVSQTLLATAPLIVYEGQQNSYSTPIQEELQFIGARSLLGVPLRSEEATHGCVILQQCDYRRAWTRGEIDMVQNVADKVAEALLKLPAEKRAREPIMQLHQRTVAAPEGQEKQSIQSVRRALKGALGQQSIPVAQKTSAPPPPPPPPPAPVQPPPPPPPPPPPGPPVTPSHPVAGESFAPPSEPAGNKGLGSILGGIKQGASSTAMAALDFGAPSVPEIPPPHSAPAQTASPWGEPEVSVEPQQGAALPAVSTEPQQSAPASSPWGDPEAATREAAVQDNPWGTPVDAPAGSPAEAWGSQELPTPDTGNVTAATPAEQWGNLDAIPAPGSGGAASAAAAAPAGAWGNLDEIPTPGAGGAASAASAAPAGAWGNLDAIPTPGGAGSAAGAADGQWGNLDSIPTPSSGGGKPGLAAMAKNKGGGGGVASPLMASFHKDKSKFTAQMPATEFVDGPPVQIDEAAAQAKLNQILSSANPTSDYIFATPGLDARMLGRIDGWVSQIAAKDKYANGHAMQVAEYSVAIAGQAGLSADELSTVRLAALVHDVGKLGAAAQILQKSDEELSDSELLLIMKHPLDGAELLESFPDLKHLAPIVRAHHEEYDGNGYPAGLKGDEIPVLARVIHVADSYHQLTSPMRFRAGMNPTEAQQVLTKGAGKQWDPRFVEALILSIMQQKVPAAFA
jgi:HD-GYP domain-containing protein (c-di-GMP phosphodiesterase class II)/GAF domain-containing protein